MQEAKLFGESSLVSPNIRFVVVLHSRPPMNRDKHEEMAKLQQFSTVSTFSFKARTVSMNE